MRFDFKYETKIRNRKKLEKFFSFTQNIAT